MGNHLYYGDNLAVLRESIADESVDLVYLDPPFNSNASYNVLFRGPSGNDSAAQIEAFDDTWHWTDAAEEAFGEVLRSGNGAAAEMLRAMRSFLGENDMMAYFAMMSVRLLEGTSIFDRFCGRAAPQVALRSVVNVGCRPDAYRRLAVLRPSSSAFPAMSAGRLDHQLDGHAGYGSMRRSWTRRRML